MGRIRCPVLSELSGEGRRKPNQGAKKPTACLFVVYKKQQKKAAQAGIKVHDGSRDRGFSPGNSSRLNDYVASWVAVGILGVDVDINVGIDIDIDVY